MFKRLVVTIHSNDYRVNYKKKCMKNLILLKMLLFAIIFSPPSTTKAILCDKLPSARRMSIEFSDGRNVGSKATFSCADGFSLDDGSKSRVCVKNADGITAEWNGQQPSCESKSLFLCGNIFTHSYQQL